MNRKGNVGSGAYDKLVKAEHILAHDETAIKDVAVGVCVDALPVALAVATMLPYIPSSVIVLEPPSLQISLHLIGHSAALLYPHAAADDLLPFRPLSTALPPLSRCRATVTGGYRGFQSLKHEKNFDRKTGETRT